jgi:hypothetical protein
VLIEAFQRPKSPIRVLLYVCKYGSNHTPPPPPPQKGGHGTVPTFSAIRLNNITNVPLFRAAMGKTRQSGQPSNFRNTKEKYTKSDQSLFYPYSYKILFKAMPCITDNRTCSSYHNISRSSNEVKVTVVYTPASRNRKVQWRPNDYESNKRDAIIQVNLVFLIGSTCFGQCFRPSSGALDYLQYLVVFTQVAADWCLGIVETCSVSIHSRHQPTATWVNTTRYCK